MRPPLLAGLALVALIALVALVAPASAAPRLDGIPTHVTAGTELRITWLGLGPEAHEAELELSLDGGRWVRVSPELDAREGGYTWHVPAGLAGPARLRLKYGGEWFEAAAEVSTPFVLEAGEGVTTMRVPDPGLGEWWCLGRGSGTLPLPQVSGAVSLRRLGPALALSPEPDRMARLVGSSVARSPARQPASARGGHAPHRVSAPRSFPLRI
jgi:hypothetical protein